ncbi:hypothetical protein CLOM_g6764, partial [Closterium sp. NIES-68]
LLSQAELEELDAVKKAFQAVMGVESAQDADASTGEGSSEQRSMGNRSKEDWSSEGDKIIEDSVTENVRVSTEGDSDLLVHALDVLPRSHDPNKGFHIYRLFSWLQFESLSPAELHAVNEVKRALVTLPRSHDLNRDFNSADLFSQIRFESLSPEELHAVSKLQKAFENVSGIMRSTEGITEEGSMGDGSTEEGTGIEQVDYALEEDSSHVEAAQEDDASSEEEDASSEEGDTSSEDSDTENVRDSTEDDSDAAATADPASNELLVTGTEDAAAAAPAEDAEDADGAGRQADPQISALLTFLLPLSHDKDFNFDELSSQIQSESPSPEELRFFNDVKKALEEASSTMKAAEEGDASTEEGSTEEGAWRLFQSRMGFMTPQLQATALWGQSRAITCPPQSCPSGTSSLSLLWLS